MKTNLRPALVRVLCALLITGAVAPARAQPILTTTFTNPTVQASDYFGWSVAALGIDRVLIGAPGNYFAAHPGAVYFFGINGTLLTTFTNPTTQNYFGISVAAVGTNRVLIGALDDDTGMTDTGAAYLFSTNGALLATFTNPTPGDFNDFGGSVAAVGTNRVLIGAESASVGATADGAAHLFGTNGALLTTFTNPTPESFERFGFSLDAVGTGRVLIGAYSDNTGAASAGAAYLFSTTGILLTTFTNPTPEAYDNFGWSVAAVGTDRVLIGAPYDNTGAFGTGAAYLFITNGTLLTTFTNPTPAPGDNFGWSVAAVGTNRVLIGAYGDDTGATNAGAAYLFSTNGVLLSTFTKPMSAASDNFGRSVVAVGTDRVLIGAWQDDTGATDAGAAYLFELPHPPLNITRVDTNFFLSWITAEPGLFLQQATTLATPATWSNVGETVSINGLTNIVQQAIVSGVSNRYYRLRRP